MEELKITSLNELKKIAEGEIVKLPGNLVVRLKRPSMLALAGSGRIPNSLLSTATEMFTKGKPKESPKPKELDDTLTNMYKLCQVMAEASLVEPTMSDLKSVGYELTDEQLIAIFNFTQGGVKALSNFREE